ncbi:hypothetical protein [Actinocrispum wychmicini]|uniref:Site-specific recombinase XerD n=1 Tax=Actinocrispum wychmicini TaxID=1213861 RepID=A0A4V6NNU1_9PSEU|nr:hypothetical protein [Actinocrispum wychmicini]TCO55620.1 hypothetical protein EV192_10741 [Actinocrispum wychmicini]
MICPRCRLIEQTTEILDDGSGQVAPALRPLHQAICSQPNPGTGLVWLHYNPHVVALMADLATGRLPLSHTTLDEHASRQAVIHLRDLLVQLQLLPYRDRYLALFENWLRRTLDAIEPAEDQQLVRRFATWHSLRQLRQRAAREALRPGLTNRPRHEINTATVFLAWLRDHGVAPETCTQTHLDTWITTGNTSRQGSRPFVVWATKNGTMPRHLHLPYHQRTPHETLTQDERLQLLRDLIDPDKPFVLRDRAAGLLLALFAQPLTRVVTLAMNDLDLTGDEVQITLGPHGPVPVPEPFGQILLDHAANRGPRNIEANRSSTWLFPGNQPGQHMHSTKLMNRLSKTGINLLGARLAAIRTLVSEMPPAVVAQALGYTAECAEDHATTAGAAWSSYASHRRQRGELTTP